MIRLMLIVSGSGQISATLASLSRTVDEYHGMAKRELIPSKQEKAYERVKNFRAELADYRGQFERMKREREQNVCPKPWAFHDRRHKLISLQLAYYRQSQ